MIKEEKTLMYINAYNRYVVECESDNIPITVTYPMFKEYYEIIKRMV